MSSCTLEVVSSPSLGDSAIAPRPFVCGEEVLREPPILLMPAEVSGDDKELLIALSRISGTDADLWRPLVSSRHLDGSTLRWLMGHLHSPLRPRPPRGQPPDPCALFMQEGEERAVVIAFSTLELFDRYFANSKSACVWVDFRDGIAKPTTRGATVFKLVAFLHACRINIHVSSATGTSSIFPTACKFAHSCNPNTIWALRESEDAPGGMVGVHVAVRSVAKGETLSFSYLGAGMNMLSDTAARKAMLSILHFSCGCPRCSADGGNGDPTRQLGCSACGKRCIGYTWTNGWQCSHCGLSPPPPALAQLLSVEACVEGVVMLIGFGRGIPKAISSLLDDDGTLLRRLAVLAGEQPGSMSHVKCNWNPLSARYAIVGLVRELLGTDHSLYILACSSLLQALYKASLMGNPIPSLIAEKGLSDLVAHIHLGDEWLKAHCNLSIHHSLFWRWAQQVCTYLEGGATKAPPLLLKVTEGNTALANAAVLANWPEFTR